MSDLLNKASLVMVPSGYKEDTVYSVVPSDGSGDLSFTRASNGTRVNSAGLVEVCPWNFIEYSEQFTSAAWATSNGATVSADQTTAPNGTTTADKIVFPANSAANIYNFPTSPVGSNNISVYAKTLSGTKQFRLRIDTGSGPAVSSNFTATTEWQRFDFAVTTTAANLVAYIFNDSTGVAGDLYVWGAQINIGSTAKPYFPTTDRLNVPRLTYQNGGGGCPSLLLEKQSTNLAYPSEDLTAWGTGGMTNTANQTTSPDGTQNADKSTIGSTARYYDVVTQGITTVGGTTYTTSFFAKKGTGIEAIYFYQGDGGARIAKWNLNNGAYIGNASSDGYSAFISYGSESVGNGWYRFWATYTAASSSGNYTIGVSTNTNDRVLPISGNGTDFVYVWGLQYEASSYPTSYIPTTSSSATRVADACYKTGISSLIGQTQGTLFVDVDFKYNNETTNKDTRIWSIWDDSDIKLISIWARDNALRYQVYDAATSLNIENSITASQGRHKVALAYNGTSLILYMDGSLVINTTMPQSAPATSRAGLAYFWYINAIQHSIGINQALLFKTALTTTELASLTTL